MWIVCHGDTMREFAPATSVLVNVGSKQYSVGWVGMKMRVGVLEKTLISNCSPAAQSNCAE